MTAGLVLAAGAGRRFGGHKLLAELDGRPLLEHALRTMAAAPVKPIVVVLGASAGEVLGKVDLHGARPVVCKRWREGQAASLRVGVEALSDAEAIVVALGDQPRVSPEAVARVVARRRADTDAVRAVYGGQPGHPVLLERSLFPLVRELRGDAGARQLLAHVRVCGVDCDGLGDPRDVDCPEQLEALRSSRPGGR